MSTRLLKFQVQLQAYNLKIVHRSGTSNKLCDHLSRWPSSEEPEVSAILGLTEEENLSDYGQDLVNHTTGDPLFQDLLAMINQNWPEEIGTEHPLYPYYVERSDLFVRRDLIFKGNRLVIPEAMIADLLQQLHLTHMGRNKMLARANRL